MNYETRQVRMRVDTTYQYVPRELLEKVLKKHGGIVGWE